MPAIACRLVAFGALAALLTGCATNPATGKRQLSLVSEQQEIQIGRQTDPQIVQQYGLYDDPDLAAYVDEIGQRLAAESERPDLPWTFRVLDDPVVNAFALPGGFIYMTRGIMAHFSSEAELAAVLGHEIGHVTARHGADRLSKAQLANLGLGVGMIAAPELAQAFGGLAQSGLQLLFLQHSRDDEREADALGFRYAQLENYDPGAFVDVFRMLSASSGGSEGARLPTYLSTHPHPEERMQTAQERVDALPPEQRAGERGQERHMRLIEDVIFGPDPRQGFFQGRDFVHPDLAFRLTLPSGWTAFNTRSAVVALSPDEDAMFQLMLAPEETTEAAARSFYGQQGIQLGQSWRDQRGGLALEQERYFSAGTGEQQILGTAAFSRYDGRTYRLLGAARSNAWNDAGRPLQETIDSFAQLTDRRLLRVEPQRVRLVTLDRPMTLEQFNIRYPSDVPMETLRRLNHHLEDTIPRGTQVKRIVGFDSGEQMGVKLQ
ncbi:MAG: M48 family metalloprotease [Acidobacteriota bacterium]